MILSDKYFTAASLDCLGRWHICFCLQSTDCKYLTTTQLTVCPWNVLIGRSLLRRQTWIHWSVEQEAKLVLFCQSTSKAGAAQQTDMSTTWTHATTLRNRLPYDISLVLFGCLKQDFAHRFHLFCYWQCVFTYTWIHSHNHSSSLHKCTELCVNNFFKTFDALCVW